MYNKRIYLSLSQQSGFEQEYVQRALETNWITSGGPNVDQFEKELEDYLEEKSFIIALGFLPFLILSLIAISRFSGQIFHVSNSLSTKTGIAL